MRKALFLGILIFFFSASLLFAQDYKSSVGLRLSSNAAAINHGISAKVFFSPAFAFEGLLTFGNSVALGFLAEKHHSLGAQGVSWYYGGGLYGGFGDSKFGTHGVLGLDYKWPAIPLNLSLDWKPELSFAKEFGFEPAVVGLTARYVIH
jgi:hypothetical protein